MYACPLPYPLYQWIDPYAYGIWMSPRSLNLHKNVPYDSNSLPLLQSTAAMLNSVKIFLFSWIIWAFLSIKEVSEDVVCLCTRVVGDTVATDFLQTCGTCAEIPGRPGGSLGGDAPRPQRVVALRPTNPGSDKCQVWNFGFGTLEISGQPKQNLYRNRNEAI